MQGLEGMKIYTKTGDQGLTSLIGGKRVPKTEGRLSAYGTVDELNAHLGLAFTALPESKELEGLEKALIRIQNELFCVGSQLACEDSERRGKLPSLREDSTQLLENEIDMFELKLPPLKNFILPGGHTAACHLHVARTVCRRAERAALAFYNDTPDAMDAGIVQYLNRLSDFLFVAARHVNRVLGRNETIWEKP